MRRATFAFLSFLLLAQTAILECTAGRVLPGASVLLAFRTGPAEGWKGVPVSLLVHGAVPSAVRASTARGAWKEDGPNPSISFGPESTVKPRAERDGWFLVPLPPSLAAEILSGRSTAVRLRGAGLKIDLRPSVQFAPYLIAGAMTKSSKE